MTDEDLGAESVREVAAEDFLYHLYRGSELLQDDRVHEAKQELENALALQPRDAKGQDLLAIVYFRLGLYPRAIAIYCELIAAYPDATTPRINLALCYLKTGQPGAARSELEQVIQRDPSHARAWGYLGLAFQRLGDLERAIAAFQTGGHHSMARRLRELFAGQAPPGPSVSTAPPFRGLTSTERDAVSRVSTEAFAELDRAEGAAFRADASHARPSSGTWAAVEPGREALRAFDAKSYMPGLIPSLAPSESLPPPSFPPRGFAGAVAAHPSSAPPDDRVTDPGSAPAMAFEGATADPPAATPTGGSRPSPPTRPPPAWRPPATAQSFARDHLLVFPRDHAVALHDSGCVLVQTGQGLAARFDTVRSISFGASVAPRPLTKKSRGREGDEPLGAPGAPLLAIEGAGQLVLGPPAGTKLVPIALTEELLTVRESAIVALEGDVVYDGARLPGGDGDFVSMVHLRGSGSVTLALPVHTTAIEVDAGRAVLVRVHAVLGWFGRVTARALAPSESPTRARGLAALEGEGMVILDGR